MWWRYDPYISKSSWKDASIFFVGCYTYAVFNPATAVCHGQKGLWSSISSWKIQTWVHVGGLVVSTPLKNMSSSVGIMTFPTERKNKIHVPNHQPVGILNMIKSSFSICDHPFPMGKQTMAPESCTAATAARQEEETLRRTRMMAVVRPMIQYLMWLWVNTYRYHF